MEISCKSADKISYRNFSIYSLEVSNVSQFGSDHVLHGKQGISGKLLPYSLLESDRK